MTVTTSTRRCALYRHFDHAGVLLYVGISDSLVARGKQHARDSEWVQFATRVESTWFPGRGEAEAAERDAIRTERPVFNRQHNSDPAADGIRAGYLLGRRGRGGAECDPDLVRLTEFIDSSELGRTKSEISHSLFKRNKTGAQIDRLLSSLMGTGCYERRLAVDPA